MHNLDITSIDDKGVLEKECVWLKATADIPDMALYLICDSTFTGENRISNELRHTYWFPSNFSITNGDFVKLMTKSGTNSSFANQSGTTTYVVHWGLGRTVWNKDGDCAVLFRMEAWKVKRA